MNMALPKISHKNNDPQIEKKNMEKKNSIVWILKVLPGQERERAREVEREDLKKPTQIL